MAKGRKKNKSLFELMDPKGVYRSPVVPDQTGLRPSERPKEQSVATKPEQTKPPADWTGQEEAAEAFVSTGEGKIRLTMNYALAVMLCFAAVILMICAVLIGWKLGRDRGVKETEAKIVFTSSKP